MGRRHHHHQPCETTPLLNQTDTVSSPTQCGAGGLALFSIILLVWYFFLWPVIHLRSFSFSHLRITDHQISGDWEIGLNLYNREFKTAKFTDIRYTVVYCGDSTNQPILDSHRQYDDLILAPKKQTVVYLRDTVENLGLNQVALSYMIMDVIMDGTIDFDLVVRITVVTGKDTKRYMMNCEGIEVTIWPNWRWPWKRPDIQNASGYARNISSCYSSEY